MHRAHVRPIAALLAALAAVLVAALAVAATTDPRGWSEGTPAVAASRALAPLPDRYEVDLPREFAKSLGETPALLVYFSPTCPHCRATAPELNDLARRLEGRVQVVGIASGVSDADDLDAFRKEFSVPYRIVHDEDRALASVLGVRSTPSALLVAPDKKAWVVHDVWYPYLRGYDTLVEMRVSADPWAAFRKGEYHGNHTCAACHVQEAEAWTLQHHSVAWATLVKSDEHLDDSCNGCHVTGKGQPTGWSGDVHSPLVDVGCESCHGPGGPHDGEATDASTTCIGCHDAKHSIAFSYAKGLPLIDHYKTVSMDDEAYRVARMAILDGTAPKELLAFGDGKFVGSDACKSCHEAEHADWRKSPHAAAMASLEKDDATGKVACVRCHASPTRGGPPPMDLAGFRTSEAVGCESCHGPGEAHVAEGGGTDNIEGLGDDCPVCVLEALCTSCHTREWDEDWSLDTRLNAVKHTRKP